MKTLARTLGMTRAVGLGLGFGAAAGIGAGVGYALTTGRLGRGKRRAALSPALDAPLEELFTATSGRVAYYADRRGSGRPILLVHGIDAAASAYEVRPFFLHWRGQRPVFAVDLPGFGFSDRRDHVYSPSLYTFAIMYLIEAITAGTRWSSADVVALSSSSEFAARAANSLDSDIATTSADDHRVPAVIASIRYMIANVYSDGE